MFRVAFILSVLLFVHVHVPAQAKSDLKQPSTFEIVSIRPVPADSMSGFAAPMGTEFRVKAVELSVLVQMAFGINPNQMILPGWAQGRKFDIQAKTGSSVPLAYEQMKPLLQAMLADRFGMTFHRETREVQGYDLVAVKNGLKLTAAQPGASTGGSGRPGAIEFLNTSMRSFAAMLTQFLKRPVADMTGASGSYEIKFRYAPDDVVDSIYPSLTTALQEQLGVRLVSAKVPVEMVVIDHLEKSPTEN